MCCHQEMKNMALVSVFYSTKLRAVYVGILLLGSSAKHTANYSGIFVGRPDIKVRPLPSDTHTRKHEACVCSCVSLAHPMFFFSLPESWSTPDSGQEIKIGPRKWIGYSLGMKLRR